MVADFKIEPISGDITLYDAIDYKAMIDRVFRALQIRMDAEMFYSFRTAPQNIYYRYFYDQGFKLKAGPKANEFEALDSDGISMGWLRPMEESNG